MEYNRGNMSKALKSLDAYMNESAGNQTYHYVYYNCNGNIQYMLGNFSLAIHYYKQSIKVYCDERSLMVVVLSRVLPQALHSEELGSDVLYAWGLCLFRPTVSRLFGSRSLQSLYMDETWRSLLQAVRFFCIEYEGWNECVESNGNAALRHLSVTHLHPANGE